ncbi:MAG: transporter substrate-binding domain-containing protein [Agarilytica sp.]
MPQIPIKSLRKWLQQLHSKILGVVAFIAVWFFLPAYAEPPLRTTYIEFAPVTYTNEEGAPDGYLIQTMFDVLKEAGYDWSIRPLPTNRMILNMAQGGLDLWIGASTINQLNEHVVAGKEPITEIHFRAYYFGNSGPYLRKEDLLGKRVIMMRGYSYNGWTKFIKDPKNGIQYFESDSHLQALNTLYLGRGDVLLDYERPINTALSRTSISNIKSNDVFSQSLYFLVSKKTPNAEQLVQTLDQAFIRLQNKSPLLNEPTLANSGNK